MSDIAGKLNNNRERLGLISFFLMVFAISWVGAVPMILQSYKIAFPAPLKILQLLMLFGTAIAAITASAVNGGKSEVKNLLRGLIKWRQHPAIYAAVLLGPAAIYVPTILISNALGYTTFTFPPLQKVLTTFATVFGVYFLLNTEEIAWRGYACSTSWRR